MEERREHEAALSPRVPSTSLISVSHFTPGPSSFLVLEEALLAGKPPGFLASLSTFGKIHVFWAPPFPFPSAGPQHQAPTSKQEAPGRCPMGRQWAWGEAKASRRPPQRLSRGPAQSRWPSLAPHTYLGGTAGSRASPALLPTRPEPSSAMGNCLHPVSECGASSHPYRAPATLPACPCTFMPLSSSPHLTPPPSFPISPPHPRHPHSSSLPEPFGQLYPGLRHPPTALPRSPQDQFLLHWTLCLPPCTSSRSPCTHPSGPASPQSLSHLPPLDSQEPLQRGD